MKIGDFILLFGILAAVRARDGLTECQTPRAQGRQLDCCPEGTLYVSQSDPQADYGSIQAAIQALPDDMSNATVLIGPGWYHEVVNVTRKGPTTLLGMTARAASWEHNTVHLWNSSFINQTSQTKSQDNADAVVLTVSPNRNASLVGSGPRGAPLQPDFGCRDFRMYNVNVMNRATFPNGTEAKQQTGPSAALFVAYANASFYNCYFASYQDTLYVGRNASAYFSGGEIRGATDYMYGFGTAFFQNVTLANRGDGGGIIAWKGSEQWYGPDTYGAYVNKSRIIASPDVESGVNLTASCALGRPWNNQSRAIFMDTYMSDIVLPQGFVQFSTSTPNFGRVTVFDSTDATAPNVTTFVESGSYGPGWTPRSRNHTLETVISTPEAQDRFSLSAIFGGVPAWIDSAFLP